MMGPLDMAQRSAHSDPGFLPASLAAARIGTWDYDVSHDRLHYCEAAAALYGLPIEQSADGVPINRLADKIHPEDRARGCAKRMHVLQHGGTFVIEYRVLPSPQIARWVLVRGFYETNDQGCVARGRGIVVDVTESKQEGFADGDVFFLTGADDQTVSALDRATKCVLAARRALAELGPESVLRLRPAADALLLEIAHHIAGTMVPIMSSQTEH